MPDRTDNRRTGFRGAGLGTDNGPGWHASATSEQLPRGGGLGYALGSVATASFGTVPGMLLMPYFTDTLGFAAFLAGAVVLLPKALDVLLKPAARRIPRFRGESG